MSNTREVQIDDELNVLLDAYDGSPDQLINRLLADHFTTNQVKLKTANGTYETTGASLMFDPECKHPEHDMFVYCPYTPELRKELGDKPL